MRILNSYWLDVVLAGLLAVSAVVVAWIGGSWEALLLDLPACVAAAMATRWPKVMVPILIGILIALVLIPIDWRTIGEYAPWIPILTGGMRGQRRERLALSLASVATVTADSFRAPQPASHSIATGFLWLLLIATLWLIGNGFQALRRAQRDAARAALAEQRLELARGLHDTVARELGRAPLAAQRAQLDGDPAELAATLESIRNASADLRRLLLVLRQEGSAPSLDERATDLPGALRAAFDGLERRGFVTATSIEQPLAPVPQRVTQALLAVVAEAVANIERHAVPNSPCNLFLSITETEADLSIMNRCGDSVPVSSASMGLLGVRERLAQLSGTLTAERQGEQWILHAWIPVGGSR